MRHFRQVVDYLASKGLVLRHASGPVVKLDEPSLFSGYSGTTGIGTKSNTTARALSQSMWSTRTKVWCPKVKEGMVNILSGKTDMAGFESGDDGITPYIPMEYVIAAYGILGFSVTLEGRGAPETVPFLGRTLHYASRTSIGDVQRAFRKFAISARAPGTSSPAQYLEAKALSYMATDYRTPVLGAVAWAFVNLTKSTGNKNNAALLLYRYKLGKSTLSVDRLRAAPPPALRRHLMCMVSVNTGWSFHTIERLHYEWLAFGLGIGPMPDQVVFLPGKHAPYQM